MQADRNSRPGSNRLHQVSCNHGGGNPETAVAGKHRLHTSNKQSFLLLKEKVDIWYLLSLQRDGRKDQHNPSFCMFSKKFRAHTH